MNVPFFLTLELSLSLPHYLAASECESSRYESVSAASLSGMSLSLATGIYQHHQTSQEQRGEGDGCRGGGEDDEGEGDGEDEDKQEMGKGAEVECGGRVCDGQDSVCADGEPRHGNDTCISAKPPSASPHMSTSQGLFTCRSVYLVFMYKRVYRFNRVLKSVYVKCMCTYMYMT